MAFTKIPDKRGLFRHSGTKFICREVFNISDVIDCNGAIVEWSDGTWRWMAGRDLHDLMSLRNVTTLADLCGAMDTMPTYRGSMAAFDDAMTTMVSYPMVLDDTTYVTTAGGYAGNPSRVTRVSPKIYGLLTAVAAGHGQSALGNVNGASGGDYCGKGIASGETIAYTLNANGVAVDGGFATRKTAIQGKGAVGGTFQHPSDFAALLGTVVIRVPLGKSWEQFTEELISTLRDSDRSEVREKCHEKMNPLMPKLKRACPVPMIYVPVELYADGWAMVDPMTFVRIVPPWGTLPAACYELYAPTRGGIMIADKGIVHTSWRWWDSSAKQQGNSRGWYRGSVPDLNTYEQNSTAVTKKGVETTQIGAIDGVRLERILGALAGCNLSDTGEKDPLYTINKTTNQLVDMWWSKLKFASTSPGLYRSTVAGGAVETDAQYEQRLTSTVQITESCAAARPTQWDTHGFSAYHGMMALLGALDGDKVSSRWLQQTWIARKYLWTEPVNAATGTYNAKGTLASSVDDLLM